jgi:hypothetical protein
MPEFNVDKMEILTLRMTFLSFLYDRSDARIARP